MNWQNFDWKKILIIGGFVLLCVILGFTLYFMFFRGASVITPTNEIQIGNQLPISNEGVVEPEGLTNISPLTNQTSLFTKVTPETSVTPASEVAEGGLTVATDLGYEPTTSIALNSDGNGLLAYNKSSGELYTLDENGNKKLLTAKKFKEADSITWSAAGNKAIMKFPDNATIIYDFVRDEQITLPSTWEDFSFNPTGTQFAFKDLENDDNKKFVGTTNSDGSGIRYVEYIGTKENKVQVQWSPSNQIVATYSQGTNGDFSKLLMIGHNQENFRGIDVNGYNVEYQYTPTGDRMVYSAQNGYSDHKPVLYIVDASGERIGYNNNSLQLNTWASKCTFAGTDTMYCAVPNEMPTGAGWYKELADNIPDSIYKINLNTGTKSFVAQPNVQYTIDQITVSEDGSNLFFTDKASQTVHKIRLQ